MSKFGFNSSQMFEFFKVLDQDLLLYINGNHMEFLDTVMWWLSSKFLWVPMYLFMVYYLFKHFGKWAALALVALFFVNFGLSDYFSGHVIRNLIARPRPSNPENIISPLIHLVNNYHGGAYGFPSSHATNSMSLALLYTLIVRNKWAAYLLFTWSFIHSYTRIYLGVHYPSDIITGWCLGALIALFVYSLYKGLTNPRIKWSSLRLF